MEKNIFWQTPHGQEYSAVLWKNLGNQPIRTCVEKNAYGYKDVDPANTWKTILRSTNPLISLFHDAVKFLCFFPEFHSFHKRPWFNTLFGIILTDLV